MATKQKSHLAKRPTTYLLDYQDAFVAAARQVLAGAGPDTKAIVTLLCRMEMADSGADELSHEIQNQWAAESDAIAFDILEGQERALKELEAGSYGPALLALIAGGDHDWDGCGSEPKPETEKPKTRKATA